MRVAERRRLRAIQNIGRFSQAAYAKRLIAKQRVFGKCESNPSVSDNVTDRTLPALLGTIRNKID